MKPTIVILVEAGTVTDVVSESPDFCYRVIDLDQADVGDMIATTVTDVDAWTNTQFSDSGHQIVSKRNGID